LKQLKLHTTANSKLPPVTFIPPYRSMVGYLVYCFFVCTVMDFSVVEKDSGMKLRMLAWLLYRQCFSHFGELWLAWSHGSGITSGM